MPWTYACDLGDLDEEDALRFDHAGRTYAIYRTEDDDVFCTDGLCPKDGAHLAGGLVEGSIVECPRDGCLFDLRDGTDKGVQGGAALVTYPVRIAGNRVELNLPG
jgi:3-phenylpropionate/trans-cinnamate dioxygenase ferredoxin component